jgi:hypothetical protein
MRSTCLLLLVLAGCDQKSIDLPVPPANVLPAVDLYDHPTGTVPVEQLATVASDVRDRFDQLQGSRLIDLLQSELTALRQRLDDGGLPFDPGDPGLEARVDAYARVNRTCRGWGDGTTPDPSDGSLEATALVKQGKLDRGLWAVARTCRGRVDVTNAVAVHSYVDGTLGIVLLGPLPTVAQPASFAVRLDGTLGTEQRQAPVTLDFRLVGPQLELLRTVDDGVIVASVGTDGVEFRGSNGTFTCTISSGTCAPEVPQ